jgi:hypothetical protein
MKIKLGKPVIKKSREHTPSEHSFEADCMQSVKHTECRDCTPISTKFFLKKDKEKKTKNTSEPHETNHKRHTSPVLLSKFIMR